MASQPLPVIPDAAARAPTPWLWRALGWLIHPWLTIRTEPAQPLELLAGRGPLLVYLLERYGISNILILEQACREHQLPPPLRPLAGGHLRKWRSVLALSRRDGIFRRPRNRTHSEGLAQLVRAVKANPRLEVQVVPVSIFVGRAPARESGWFRVLFSENWSVVGRFRRLLAVILNGRDTIVHFSEPIQLRDVVNEGLNVERTVRKASRVMRARFAKLRTAVIGADLSHRRTLIDAVMNAESVRDALRATASRESLSLEQAEGRARSYAWEIAADYSHPAVRSASFVLRTIWTKLFDGIQVHHFDTLKQAAPGHEVIYVPCHRSHMDYLLVSYLLYENGIVPPHIAAGVNLNLPFIGSLLRKGGAFFLRRSFKANALYSAVFTEYVRQLFQRGVSLEYFIEGGRSRSGRMLEPRAGMLAMTLRSFLAGARRPVLFQPVYIGYERLLEGKSYIGELSGKPKEKESLFGLLRSLKLLREQYGKVAVSFGEPIQLLPFLDTEAPSWREDANKEERPAWFADSVDRLADRIATNINRSADVNPVNLLALALLATPKHAMAEDDLGRQIELIQHLLAALPYSDRVTVSPLSGAEVIRYGERMRVIERVRHPLGDLLRAEGEQAVMLSYFRNNVLHLLAAPGWIACCFLNNRRLQHATVTRLGRFIYPFIQNELYLAWDADGFVVEIEKSISEFLALGLLEQDEDGKHLRRRVGQTDEAYRLRVLAMSLSQAFERYYIALALLVKCGPRALSSAQLETQCQHTAQRLSLLHTQAAPEFFDRSLFRGFINTLKARRIVWLDDQARLDFGTELDSMASDAKLILSRDLRHSILKLTCDPERASDTTA
ncbi:MAG: glycerol-3-phosphate 1-O-acyltransferase PlsB [Lysobacterales bacterium]